MKKQTMGMMISSLRKENGMTQLELAVKMGVTDKAVSKWERDLSCPDVNSLPKLAEIFQISVDELMQIKTAESNTASARENIEHILHLVFKDTKPLRAAALRDFFLGDCRLSISFQSLTKIVASYSCHERDYVGCYILKHRAHPFPLPDWDATTFLL